MTLFRLAMLGAVGKQSGYLPSASNVAMLAERSGADNGRIALFCCQRCWLFLLFRRRWPCWPEGKDAAGDASVFVSVSMMNVREVGVLVGHHSVRMPMRVRLGALPFEVVLMLVVAVMRMVMRMGQRLMQMFVIMLLGQVQPDPQGHKTTSQPERRRGGFAKQPQRQCGANKGCG